MSIAKPEKMKKLEESWQTPGGGSPKLQKKMLVVEAKPVKKELVEAKLKTLTGDGGSET